MKNYIDESFFDIDYCKYSDWKYKKRTRIWTNKKNFIPKICKNDCGNSKHINLGRISSNTMSRINERYKIPPLLIKELLVS